MYYNKEDKLITRTVLGMAILTALFLTVFLGYLGVTYYRAGEYVHMGNSLISLGIVALLEVVIISVARS